ncbi:hypothetical protein D3C84_1156800 [compost metagenome]
MVMARRGRARTARVEPGQLRTSMATEVGGAIITGALVFARYCPLIMEKFQGAGAASNLTALPTIASANWALGKLPGYINIGVANRR